MIDTAYLGLLSMYGGFPKSIKSVLFTGLTYGLPALLSFAGMEDSLPVIQHFPKYATRLGMLYSAISTAAIALVVLASIPLCYKLMSSDAVQEAVQSVVDSGKQSRPSSVGVTEGRGMGDGESGGYEGGEDEDGDEVDGEEDDEEDESVPVKKQQQPQVRSTRQKQGKVRQ